MNFPADLLYHSGHLWVRLEANGQAALGLSDFAQEQLGKVIFLDLPAPGQAIAAGREMGAVESAKSVSDLIAPVAGEVLESNQRLEDEPHLVNQEPYGAGWLCRVALAEGEPAGLWDARTYQERLAK